MDNGKDIVFIKAAEHTNCQISEVSNVDDGITKEVPSTSVEDAQSPSEKEAQAQGDASGKLNAIKNLLKKSLETIKKYPSISKPTESGVVGALGLGTAGAALAAAYRSGNPKKKHSFMTNPILAGVLGAASGYVGGNQLDKLLKLDTENKIFPKWWPSHGDKTNDKLHGFANPFGILNGKPAGTLTGSLAVPSVVDAAKAHSNRVKVRDEFSAIRDQQNLVNKAELGEKSVKQLADKVEKAIENNTKKINAVTSANELKLKKDISAKEREIADYERTISAKRDRIRTAINERIKEYHKQNKTSVTPQDLAAKLERVNAFDTKAPQSMRNELLELKSRTPAKPQVYLTTQEHLLARKEAVRQQLEAARAELKAQQAAVSARKINLENGAFLESGGASAKARSVLDTITNLLRRGIPKKMTAAERAELKSFIRSNGSKTRFMKSLLLLPAIAAALEGKAFTAPDNEE